MQNQREEALEPPGLACNGLTLGYDGRPVIEGLDLSLPPGGLACHRRRVPVAGSRRFSPLLRG